MKKWKTQSGHEIFQIMSGRSNVFLLTNGKTNILIDTSIPRLWNKLVKRLDYLGIKSIDYLILTHAHFDHAGNAKRIKERFKACIIVQKDEEGYLSAGDNILPRGTTLLTRAIIHFLGERLILKFRYDPCKPDFIIDSVYDLKELGFNAYLIHTPGHTSGSMSLIIDDEIAIVGDTMFGVFKWSVFPPYGENIDLMIKSWGKLLETKCLEYVPSHGTANSRVLVQKDYYKRINRMMSYKGS
ncbi:MBL fold metallo-hydrolase [candidate division KSB1 bacterium]|nr:MBL fold metallo-hydrolase [candidate division KSB1 bacterium]